MVNKIEKMKEKLEEQFEFPNGHFELEIKDFLTREMTNAFFVILSIKSCAIISFPVS